MSSVVFPLMFSLEDIFAAFSSSFSHFSLLDDILLKSSTRANKRNESEDYLSQLHFQLFSLLNIYEKEERENEAKMTPTITTTRRNIRFEENDGNKNENTSQIIPIRYLDIY